MYLDAAEQEREKYMQEMAVYKQTEAYRLFNEHKQKKKLKLSLTDEVIHFIVLRRKMILLKEVLD